MTPGTSKTRIITLIAVVAVYAGITGCATNKDLEKLRDDLTAQTQAAQAEAAAASREAAEAKAMAESAMDTANDAMATSADTEEKIDRMFKRSMYK